MFLLISGKVAKDDDVDYDDDDGDDDGDDNDDNDDLDTEKQRIDAIRNYVNDFIHHCNIHGLSYIIDNRHPIRRILWFFITVLAFGYSMEKVYESTVHYLEYPFSTSRRRQHVDELKFPAVSFCNMNDMRFSVMNGTMVDKAIFNQSISHSVTVDDYSISRTAQHTLPDMLVECIFDGQECSTKNFTEFSWKNGDRCFTFNSGKPGHHVRSVSGMGVHRSLLLTVNIQHYEYYRYNINFWYGPKCIWNVGGWLIDNNNEK